MTVKLGEKVKYQHWVGTHPGAIPDISLVFEKTWLLKEVPRSGVRTHVDISSIAT